MAWGSISLFGGFLENENSLETLIVIFKNVSPKGSFWLKMKYFEISVLTANSRYLQTAALKLPAVASRCLPEQSFHGVIKTFILLSGKNKLELLPFSLYSEMFNRRGAALKSSLFSRVCLLFFCTPPPPSPPVNIAGIWILKFLFVSFENEG